MPNTASVTENAAKHTPGPWTVAGHNSLEIRSEDFGGIGFVHSPLRGGNRERQDIAIAEANARLIAAAPDLLQAAKDTLDYWETTGFAKCHEGCDCIVDSIRAAIAKAEGR